jgi:hypothetical protein
MFDIDTARDEFTRYLATHENSRIDDALAHVVDLAYEQGLTDGKSCVLNSNEIVVQSNS